MRALLAAVVVAAAAGSVAHATPTRDAPLEDSAGVVSADDETALDAELIALRTDSGVQLGVMLIKTTGGQSIEGYTHDRAVEWSSGSNAAALLVLAIKDRKSRLEVSDLLRSAFPDARAQAILDNIRGYLRKSDYAGAIRAVMTEVGNGAAGVAPDLESPHPQVPLPSDSTTPSPPPEPPTTYEPPEPSYTPPKDHTLLWIIIVGGGAILLCGFVWAKSRVASRATLTAGDALPGRPLWLETLVCVGLIIGGLLYIALILAASGNSRRGYSSSSSTWSGGSSSGGGWSGGSSSGGGSSGGWSGGGASSSW